MMTQGVSINEINNLIWWFYPPNSRHQPSSDVFTKIAKLVELRDKWLNTDDDNSFAIIGQYHGLLREKRIIENNNSL